MDYTIEEIDIADKLQLAKVNALLGKVFGEIEFPSNKLELKTNTNDKNKSLYLVAVLNGEVIGFSGFISHTFYFNGEPINCYQICWVATSDEHRGKGIFPNLIQESKKILKDRKAGFLFGFPNDMAYPIYMNKLGFKEIQSVKLKIPNFRFLQDLFLKNQDLNLNDLNLNSIIQDDLQLINWKKKEYGDEVIVINEGKSIIWGLQREQSKKGIKFKYFDVGGLSINKIADIKPMFHKLAKLKNNYYLQFVMPENNSYNSLFKTIKPAQTNNLIIFDLNLDTSNCNFNLFSGVKDVY